MDDDLQKEVAAWNPEAAEKVAHKLSLEVLQWLIKQKIEGRFEGKELGRSLWRETKAGIVAISQLDLATQKQIASLSPEETNKGGRALGLGIIIDIIDVLF